MKVAVAVPNDCLLCVVKNAWDLQTLKTLKDPPTYPPKRLPDAANP